MKLLAIAFASMFVVCPAFAGKEKCKDVKIVVVNDSARDIKVTDIKYYDTTISDWRNENAVDGKIALEGGGKAEYTRGLEEVLNDPGMKVKVEYKTSIGGKWKDASWSSPSPAQLCTKGTTYTVTVN
jgi:hypothetical protein